MKKLLIIIFLFTLMYGDVSYKLENNLKLSNTNYNFSGNKSEDNINKYINRAEYSNYLDVSLSDKFFISSGIVAFSNSEEILNAEYGDFFLDQSKSGIYIEKLYAQVLLYHGDYKLSFVYGVIPLKGGNFKRFSEYNEQKGNGLFTLVNFSLLGGFLVYGNDNHNLRIGQAIWEDSFYNDENLGETNGGSEGIFIFYDYAKNNHLIELNFINANFIKDNYKLGEINLYGLGYSYDDTSNSGWAVYTILGYSIYKSQSLDWMHNSGRFDEDTIKTLEYANENMPELYNFNNDTWRGYSVLLGTKKLMDVKGKDIAIGLEYFKASDNWVSMNIGTANTNNSYGYWKHRGGNTFKLYSDFYIKKDLILHADYTYSYDLKAPLSGTVADVGDNENLENLFRQEKILSFKLIYKF